MTAVAGAREQTAAETHVDGRDHRAAAQVDVGEHVVQGADLIGDPAPMQGAGSGVQSPALLNAREDLDGEDLRVLGHTVRRLAALAGWCSSLRRCRRRGCHAAQRLMLPLMQLAVSALAEPGARLRLRLHWGTG